MSTSAEGINEVFLQPGEFHFGYGKTRISTLLGSCVSITLWHPRRRIGGMCHYMLSERNRPAAAALDGRFGREACALFRQQVAAAGTRPEEYQAKLFGGANMLGDPAGGSCEIGWRNVALGRQWLAASRIALIAEHVGGSGRRKVRFDLWSGDVWLASARDAEADNRSAHG
ncbi:MAG: chemotaxis protein CheD [Dechloromonas sp.]|nr:chemotaxis protein CheD [Dechloromonas sp.]